jgi:hypothetical protein
MVDPAAVKGRVEGRIVFQIWKQTGRPTPPD